MRNNHTTNPNTIKILLNNNKLSKYNILFDYIQKKKKQETQQNKMRLKRRVKGSNSRRKMKQPPPSPKAVKASPSKRQTPAGVQVSLPLGSIKNFQHLHNAPLSQYSTQAVASPSPKAQKMRKRVVEQKPASSNNNNFENNFFPEPPMKSAVQNARHHSRMASTRLQEKQAKLAAFQKRIKARVSNRVKKEKQTAMKQRQAWVNLENKAESSARRVAQGVKNTLKTNRSMVTYSKTPSLKKSTKLTLDEHIVNVTANTQAARLALFAHSKQGKLAMKQAVQPHLNVPAFSMGAAINNKDATVVGENESPNLLVTHVLLFDQTKRVWIERRKLVSQASTLSKTTQNTLVPVGDGILVGVIDGKNVATSNKSITYNEIGENIMLIRTIDTDTDEVVKLETITLLDDAATSRTRVTQYFTLSNSENGRGMHSMTITNQRRIVTQETGGLSKFTL